MPSACSSSRCLGLGILVLGSALFLRIAAQDASTGTAESAADKYVGPDVCRGCHEESYQSFAKSAHAKTLNSKNETTRGCEGCHGPGADHVAAGGDPDKIWRFVGVKPNTILDRCTHCHETNLAEAHAKAHLTCLSCHSEHHPQQRKALLVKAGNQLCGNCHRH